MSVSTGTALEAVVGLRLVIRGTRDRASREALREIEERLAGELPVAITKRVAARLLGVSVPALDRWVDRGSLPAVSQSSTSRLGVERNSLLELAVEVAALRREGVDRGVLARAFERLGRPDGGRRLVYSVDVAALPRPNARYAELRRDYDASTPESRVLEQDALHRSLNRLGAVVR